ncbi:MAG: hypothetical protein CBE26_01405 [Kiritimatiellaceae bacterium TMED266]|nr:MAG: hypothetical protein CBE26_01405 [Kiritimatiellaceae bacterium TMED266]
MHSAGISRRDFATLSAVGTLAGCSFPQNSKRTADVCVYGGTASGVMAAVAAAREGCQVILIEPSRWLGGMTGGGLSHIDWGRPEAVGGSTRTILSDGINDLEYRTLFAGLVKEHGISVIYEHRVSTVHSKEVAIRSIELDFAPPDRTGCPIPVAVRENALQVFATIFIDCSYEGDLMAKAGVSYTYGREAASQYGESLGGVQPNMAVYDIDPYVRPGDPRSGLLPLLQDRQMEPLGAADKLTMGYGFRWKFSDGADRLPIAVPENYDPRTFELYRRAFQNNVKLEGRQMSKLGVYKKTKGWIYAPGTGNLARSLLAPAVYGSNAGYPDGDWATRSRIWKFHQDFMGGMTHFLRTDPTVPMVLKKEAASIGFMPGIFDDSDGWPHQMYVREARRMVSEYVVTQKDLEGTTDPSDSVGLASYGVDDWPYAMFPFDGKVALNSGMFSMLYLDEVHRGIYKIPYRSITPLKTECRNLLVPVCVSASHIAMTSIRMEPVWMILGESAGVAAALALRDGVAVQDVNYKTLRARSAELGQRLERLI